MKAAVLRAVGQPLCRSRTWRSACRGPREVLIRTSAVGVCHSDLHFIEGSYKTALPTVLGHEAAGIVEKVGAEVRTVKVGDHVVTCLSTYCGHCEYCLTGHMSLCPSPDTQRGKDEPPRLFQPDGGSMTQYLNLSAFAEHMLVHEHACVAIRKRHAAGPRRAHRLRRHDGDRRGHPHRQRPPRRDGGGHRLRRGRAGDPQRRADRRRGTDHRHRPPAVQAGDGPRVRRHRRHRRLGRRRGQAGARADRRRRAPRLRVHRA